MRAENRNGKNGKANSKKWQNENGENRKANFITFDGTLAIA